MITQEKKAEMIASVADWKRSSMTKGAYAQSVGISKSKFEYWVRKVHETGLSVDDFPGFVEMHHISRPTLMPEVEKLQDELPTPRAQAVLAFPGGLCLKIYGQMLGLSANLRYYLCCSTIDIRNGFDGLAGIVRNHLKKDPISGDVFVFLNKTRTHIKLLYWDGDGFALFYKRLERGRYALSAHNEPSKQIGREELLMLLEGLSFQEMSRKKRYKFS